ncbi:MAG: hypothetical protein AABX28_00045 [Nanoarchaeota archaeon]
MEKMNQQQTDDSENSGDDGSDYPTSQMPLKQIEKNLFLRGGGFGR